MTSDEMHELAERMLADADDGPPLAPDERALVKFGLAASVTALSRDGIDQAIGEALDAGVTGDQLQEIASLVSGLGVHSLMVTAVPIAEATGSNSRALTPAEQALWDKYLGDDPYWIAFDRETPGFLAALLRLSTEQFTAFFDYCAVPWKSRTVRGRLKELIAMACDATPAHCFSPGFRLHLTNAIALEAGKVQVMQTLELAASMTPHKETR